MDMLTIATCKFICIDIAFLVIQVDCFINDVASQGSSRQPAFSRRQQCAPSADCFHHRCHIKSRVRRFCCDHSGEVVLLLLCDVLFSCEGIFSMFPYSRTAKLIFLFFLCNNQNTTATTTTTLAPGGEAPVAASVSANRCILTANKGTVDSP